MEEDEAGQRDAEPAEVFLNGHGLAIDWGPISGESILGRRSYKHLAPQSPFVKTITSLRSGTGPASTLLSRSQETLFRVQVPAGKTLHDLVPAVGGGFRGMIRGSTSTTFSRHARLVPAAGGTATAMATGPLIGLIVLCVGADLLGQVQQDKKYKEISQQLAGIQRHLSEQQKAQLITAETKLNESYAALLDNMSVPHSVGLDGAMNGLSNVKNQALSWLLDWERISKDCELQGSVPYRDLSKQMADVHPGGIKSFPAQVATLYKSIALDSRAAFVTLGEAQASKPDGDFYHFRHQVEARLNQNAMDLMHLQEVVWKLVQLPISSGASPAARKPGKHNAVDRFRSSSLKVLRGLVDAPEGPAVLDSNNAIVLELVSESDGSLRVLAPEG